ncbi:MAG: cofactor-independent phosphoglycerate mutase [Clostridium sp.]|nr:cofactor-independent phosphoglycerate mutase [Clostridium sp.]
MADWHNEELGGKTLLQAARTPYMDMLARKGRTGLLQTVPEGFHPGSEVANSTILGYDQNEVYEGRGPLEAAAIGVNLAPDDMAIRCNLVCIENEKIKNHSCGHLETEDAKILIEYLQDNLGTDRIHFYPGIQYRHLLVIKGGNKHVHCTPPHDVPGQAWHPLLVKASCNIGRNDVDTELTAQQTADILNDLTVRSQELLSKHKLNKERIAQGKDPANSIWVWAGGYRPQMKPLSELFPQITRGAVITAVDLVRGIGTLAGLECIDVEGATGLYDTNYEGKAKAAIKALKDGYDFVYLHIEASDEAGHEGNMKLKLQTIEALDSRIIGPVYEALKDEDIAIAVLPDHPTPVHHRTHTSEPVPFLIYMAGMKPDTVRHYDEDSCKDGHYGQLEKDGFMKALMDI